MLFWEEMPIIHFLDIAIMILHLNYVNITYNKEQKDVAYGSG